MIRRPSFLLLILGAALCAAACGREEPRQAAAVDTESVVPVAAEAARRGRLRAVIRVTGVVTPAAGSEFIETAPEPTRILDVPHMEGDRVARGVHRYLRGSGRVDGRPPRVRPHQGRLTVARRPQEEACLDDR